MKALITAGLAATLLAGAGTAQAFDDTVTLGAVAGSTGLGGEVSWRFSRHFALTANYAGGLEWDGDYETEEVNYEGDLDISAAAIKFDLHPFGGGFFLSAGAMLPDMEANVTGRANESGNFEFDGQTYSSTQVGTLNGQLTIADGVQPYLGLGWRSSQDTGFGFFSELGVMATDIEVSLSSSKGLENSDDDFRQALRDEEQRLEDDADELSVYPVATIGIRYTF